MKNQPESLAEYNQRLRLTAQNSTDKSTEYRFLSKGVNRIVKV